MELRKMELELKRLRARKRTEERKKKNSNSSPITIRACNERIELFEEEIAKLESDLNSLKEKTPA